jgi:hypothetical protein
MKPLRRARKEVRRLRHHRLRQSYAMRQTRQAKSDRPPKVKLTKLG